MSLGRQYQESAAELAARTVDHFIKNSRLDTPEYRAALQSMPPAKRLDAALADLADVRRVEAVAVDLIEVLEGRRSVDDQTVERIADSMLAIGLRTPITVRYYETRPAHIPGPAGDMFVLVAGGHRLAAARRLGWEQIECFVDARADDIDSELWEIVENFHRADLTKDQRDYQIRRYAELLAQKEARDKEVSTQIGAKPKSGSKGGRPKEIAQKVAEQTGLSKSTVRRALNPDLVEQEKARAEKKAQQAEFDRQRAEAAASLPSFVAEREQAKAAAIARQKDGDVRGLSDADRIAELEEAVRVLEAENAQLKAENKLYAEMKVQFEQGGFDKVVAGKDEDIRVAQARFYQESADKASWMKSAKTWEKRARDLGWSSNAVIDIETGEIVDG